MCIGIKPVLLPSQCAKRNIIRDAAAANATAITGTGSSPSVAAILPTAPSSTSKSPKASRKRPLNADIASDSFCQGNRKMMRYSSCTCDCENGDCGNKRKVRFGGFKTYVKAAHTFTEEDRKNLWYGLDECAGMNEASKKRVKEIRTEQNKDMLRHVLCVASQCSYSPPPLAYLQTVRLHFADDTRGLELGLMPLRIRQRRHEHVKRVVEVQTQIVSGKIPLKNDENVNAKALAIQSLRSSQASKLFAELLARNVAADVQEGVAAVFEQAS